VASAAARLERGHPRRVRGVGLAIPGPVRDGHLADAPLLGWRDLDLRTMWTGPTLVVAGNDATLAAAGEARRGAARGAGTHLHLLLEAGMGGAVTAGGHALEGAHGAAGEFGHLPFGDPAVACPCGAHGCWGRTLDGGELAGLLDDPPPADPVGYSARVLDRAAGGDRRALAAAARLGTALGRGTAGLVNALDPDVVTLGGLAQRLLEVVPDAVDGAYRAGLMTFRRAAPPPLVPAGLGDAAPLVGATERVWDDVWDRLR
jgi:predicted NBD/HSP70 family sugar kinase